MRPFPRRISETCRFDAYLSSYLSFFPFFSGNVIVISCIQRLRKANFLLIRTNHEKILLKGPSKGCLSKVS